jgi:hypothetical protein
MAKNKVEIQIRAEADKASKELKKFSKETARGLKEVKQESRSTSESFGKLKVAAVALAAAYTAFKGLQTVVGFLKDSGKAAEEEELAMRKLHAVIISMKRDVPGFEKSMLDLASAMQKQTGYADDQIMTAIQFLSTYKEITNDVMPRALQLTVDIARGWGVDLRTAANMTGKAAMGLTGELRRYGITVDRSTYESRGFIGVLEEIEAQVKGQAKAYRESTTGLKEWIQAVWGDVKEQFGYIVNQVLDPFRKSVGEILEGLSGKLQEWREGVDLKTWATEAAAKFKEFSDKLINELIPALDNLLPKLEKNLDKIGKSFDWLSRNYEKIKGVLKSLDKVSEVAKKILSYFPGTQPYFDKARKNVEDLGEVAEDTSKKIEKTPIEPHVDTSVTYEEIQEILQYFRDLKTEVEKEPIKIRIVKETVTTGGGTEYEYGKRFGGLIHKQHGGFLPGYGGGDQIPLMAEAGEYVLRKEAVRALGTDFLNALNRGGSAKDYMVLDLRMGDRAYPLTVENSGVVDQLMEDVRRHRMTRS